MWKWLQEPEFQRMSALRLVSAEGRLESGCWRPWPRVRAPSLPSGPLPLSPSALAICSLLHSVSVSFPPLFLFLTLSLFSLPCLPSFLERPPSLFCSHSAHRANNSALSSDLPSGRREERQWCPLSPLLDSRGRGCLYSEPCALELLFRQYIVLASCLVSPYRGNWWREVVGFRGGRASLLSFSPPCWANLFGH